jgi:ATP-dependent protease Clp ATPase subunit
LCKGILDDELRKKKKTKKIDLTQLPKPAQITEFLNQYVIGQDQSKKVLLFLHSKLKSKIKARHFIIFSIIKIKLFFLHVIIYLQP